MSTNDPQIPEGGPPAELGDPTDSVDQGTGSPVPAVDVGGQAAPAPDTVGVSEGQKATVTPPDQPVGPTPANTTTAGAATVTTTTDTAAADAERAEIDQQRADAAVANRTPVGAPVPNVEPTQEFTGPASINLLDDPDAKDTAGADDTVLVSASDPVLGPAVGRWLEREAARDARLSPLVGAINLLDNVQFSFKRDDPIFTAAPPPEEAEVKPQPQLVG